MKKAKNIPSHKKLSSAKFSEKIIFIANDLTSIFLSDTEYLGFKSKEL